MKQNFSCIFIIAVISVIVFSGWGYRGHQKINYFTTTFFPNEMNSFMFWNDSLYNHASDPDNRNEPSSLHFIDIDLYAEFNTAGTIPQDKNVLIAKYGSSFVNSTGTLPWVTIAAFDSLKNTFQRRDWHKAVLFASDLGHYVGDGHNPLHITKDFNRYGIHSPYESTMITKYGSLIYITKDTISCIPNVSDFIFSYLYENYVYADSIFIADDYAMSQSSFSRNDKYYGILWDRTKNFTIKLFNNASKRLAALMYTAWTNAGKPQMTTSVIEDLNAVLNGYEIYQNYPNPFNPDTKIKFSLPRAAKVMLKIYDAAGRELNTLVNEEKSAGVYEYSFNANGLPSGVYYYNLNSGSYSSTKKMVLMK